MNPVEIEHVAKSFGAVKAVEDVSFEVQAGEIFGLLGPNGAGKTTTIRMALDIFKPDQGTVAILGGPMSDAKKNRIGYLPEERGLYQDAPLESCLLYFAALKGLKKAQVMPRLNEYLERFDLSNHRKKKVKELSKGMQQKAQVISTVLHHPELLIIDEPFSGLDPVNTELVRALMAELRAGGATIILCTHQMHQVEELCDRLVLIDQGRNVLYGKLSEIRRQYATGEVLVSLGAGPLGTTGPLGTGGPLPELAGVRHSEPENGSYRLSLNAGVTPNDLLAELLRRQIVVEKFEIAMPSLHEIFVQLVGGKPNGGAQ